MRPSRRSPMSRRSTRPTLATNWWRHLLMSIPLGWCGMWAGWLWSLLLVPLFGWACVRAARQSQPLLLLYAAPAVVMLGLHAVLANHYTRYNLILIGRFRSVRPGSFRRGCGTGIGKRKLSRQDRDDLHLVPQLEMQVQEDDQADHNPKVEN